jgi:hypothetical protein
MEARVERLHCSVGIEGWRRTDVDMPLLIAGYRRGSAGDVITARLYHNLTGSRYPMKAREIIALERSRQSISSQVRHAWSYHEGAFYHRAVDTSCPIAADVHVYEADDDDVYDALLNQTDIATNANKYYITVQEVQEVPGGRRRGPQVRGDPSR